MFTYSDAIEHLQDYCGGAADAKGQSFIRRSVVRSYKDISQHSKGWRYYIRRGRVRQKAPVSSSTITYTSSTRVLALASGSWPTWAPLGVVRIDNVDYQIDSVSGGNAILNALNCPLDDIAAGTSYELYQTEYPLPADFQDIVIPSGYGLSSNSFDQSYVTPEQWYAMEKTDGSEGDTYYWTIIGSQYVNSYGVKALCVRPIPSTTQDYEFLYRRRAREVRYSGYEPSDYAGTISISGTTVTGSGTSFTSRMVGSVIRLTDSTTTTPTGFGGLNPYTEEFVITAVASATSLSITNTPSLTYSGCKYRISDAMDVDQVMIDCLLAGCEYQIEMLRNKSDASIGRIQSKYDRSLVQAFERDIQLPIARAGVPFCWDYSEAPVTGGLSYTVDI